MLNVAQNNPILYIFIDCGESLINGIKNVQRERMGPAGIGYLELDGLSDIDHDIKTGISICHSMFITKKYFSAGEIKVNYVLDGDSETGLRFPAIKERAEYYLRYLYPAGAVTNVFLLVDDRLAMFSAGRRNEVIDCLLELHSEACPVYILSNVNSCNLFSPDNMDNIINSIALLAFIKDCVPEKRSWYNEQYFIKDCFTCGGNFLTVGHLNIEKYYCLIKEALTGKLLSLKNIPSRRVPFEVDMRDLFMEKLYILPEMLLPVIVGGLLPDAGVSNGQLLKMVFDGRLDLFYEMNLKGDQFSRAEVFLRRLELNLQDALNSRDFGFYATLELVSPKGGLLKKLVAYKDEYQEYQKKSASDFNSFMSDANGQTGKKLKLGLFKIDGRPYELGAEYLRLKYAGAAYAEAVKTIEKAIDSVNTMYKKLVEIEGRLNNIRKGYHTAYEYYEKLADEYMSENMDGFLDVYKNIYACASCGDFSKYLDMLKSYIDDELFPQGIFKESVSEEIYADIMEWLSQNRQYNIFLKTGGMNLHSHINILADSQVSVFAKASETGGGEISFFHGDNGGSVDILYQLGAFVKEDLYYLRI